MRVALLPLSVSCQHGLSGWSSLRTSKILAPQPDLGRVSELPCVAWVSEYYAKTSVRMFFPWFRSVFGSLLLLRVDQEVLGVAMTYHSAQVLNFFHALSQTLLQAIAEALAGLPRPRQLDGKLLTCRRLRL